MFGFGSIAAFTGITGTIALIAAAVFGAPVVPTLAKFADAIFTPVLTALGSFGGSLLKMELDGTLDVLQTGQRILAVVTLCAITWNVAGFYERQLIWQQVHANYTLSAKATGSAVKHRR